MQAPVLVLNTNTQRETGRRAQLANIAAAKAVSDIVRTTLGPKSMLKMLLDPMGGIVLTNDGNAILREIDVAHPAAKSMLELSRSQDEECGDGTTSVIILAGELLVVAEPFIKRGVHPTVIVNAYHRALEAALEVCERMAIPVNTDDHEAMRVLMRSCVGTKFSSRYGDLVCDLALEAVRTVAVDVEGAHALSSSSGHAHSSNAGSDANGASAAAAGSYIKQGVSGSKKKEIDVKRYAKVEKLPGGELSECRVLKGVMLEKDATHPRMARKIVNPRVVLLDCPLEYKKAESAAALELAREEDFAAILRQEEEYISKMCSEILALKPDVVVTEKGVSDLASHFFVKAGVTALRRVRKTDNLRIARATGATIVSRPDELQESDVGTGCGLFEIRKIGSEDYFSFFEQCKDPKACTIILRGGSKDVLMELERNLADALQVARNVVLEPKLLPGGGAVEMAISAALAEKARGTSGAEGPMGAEAWPFAALGEALEVVPRTLAQNAGGDVVRTLTELRAAKARGAAPHTGIDGVTGQLADMAAQGVVDPFSVRTQALKSAVEAACLLLRIDDVLSGMRNKKWDKGGEDKRPAEEQDADAGGPAIGDD